MSTPQVLVLPGASLMEVEATDDGVRVRCPGCGVAQTYPVGKPRTTSRAAFVHEAACPVHQRIADAQRRT